MQKVYNRIYWENEPSHNTPLSESNLNKLDYALDVVDTRVAELSGYEERAEESADSANTSAIEVRELKRQVQALVDTVKEITATATTLNPGSSATASFDSDTGVLSLGIPKGDSGITAPVNGMYTMYVDEDGNLWLVTNGEQGSEYWWQYNPTTGELYYRTPGEYVEKTMVGDVIVEITDGVEGFPIKSLVAEITPVQSGSGDPSPTNVRAISGRTGMTVTRAGKNLFSSENQLAKVVYRATVRPFEDNVNAYYLSGASGAQDTQTMAVSAWAFCRVVLGYTEEELTLTVSCKVRNYTDLSSYSGAYGYVGIIACDADGQGSTTISRGSFTNVGVTTVTATATIPAGKYYGLIFSPVSSATTVTLTQYTEVYDIQLQIGSTASAYEPYLGASYPITWESIAGTVYGGTLDVVSGVLTVTHTMVTLDGDTNKFTNKGSASAYDEYYFTAEDGYTFGKLSTYVYGTELANSGFLCSAFPIAPGGGTVGDYATAYIGSAGTLQPRIRFTLDRSLNTIELANAYLAQLYAANTPVQIVYKLATPQTYQLTPTEIAYIETLNGINILYTDAGSINEVTYIVESYEED